MTSPITTAPPVTVTCAGGGAGTSTGTATGTTTLLGELEGVYIDYTTAPATTDVTVSIVNDDGQTIVAAVITSANTDGYFGIRVQMRDAAGAVIAGVWDRHPLVGAKIKVDVAQGDVGSVVKVTPVYHRGL